MTDIRGLIFFCYLSSVLRHLFYIHFMQEYEDLRQEHSNVYTELRKKYRSFGNIRLLLATGVLTGIYFIFSSDYIMLPALLGLAALVAFILLVGVHRKLAWRMQLHKVLKGINEDECSFLKRESNPFPTGEEFKAPTHFYANDLDIFGEASVYQHLNRTATFMGKTRLAQSLLTLLQPEDILKNQAAIAELAKTTAWRQEIYALGKIAADSPETYRELIRWSRGGMEPVSKPVTALSFIGPAIVIGLLAALWITGQTIWLNFATLFFLANLSILGLYMRRIRQEALNADRINEIISRYSLIIEKIESAQFKSEKLLALQSELSSSTGLVSKHIKDLSLLFSRIDSIQNVMGALLFNGLFLSHIHSLRALLRWKHKHAAQIESWLLVIGEIETLNSLAQFAHNNPGFAFPALNQERQIAFTKLGHPLIAAEKRICNTVDFNGRPFIIITGSNMSGKSTFLRTLGVNMVLAGMGSVVCAEAAGVHPLPVLVSMQLSDSLTENESYFFAEVRRLNSIMEVLKAQTCFVLLDEILRGTNSDDKRSGTIGVIRKLVQARAIGAIATHDLEVCLTEKEFPEILTNQCFEVDIINEELHFDYSIRPGICKNKSASFLMKKMKIID